MKDKILQTILEVAQTYHPSLTEVSGNSRLREDLGFDSLGFARLVALLEIKLEMDPFATMSAGNIYTVEDVCNAYLKMSGEVNK